ncbi:DNA-directed RNA polymerase I subunit 2-like, partial [Bidens hawaiensis]|uniref:DNA-directed RNA polymerase I subunit 2-like n=1 Tax=Bidens hawaiensis TaxID=980011 RepID=UPI00404A479F
MATKPEAMVSRANRMTPHLPNEPDYEPLRELFSHHIHSFDHFIECGLETALMNIKPIEVVDPSTELKLRIWFDKPELYPPQKERSSRQVREALYPFECRQAKISYTGKFLVNVCFQYGDGSHAPVIREQFNFGQLPIMLKSKLCHLRDADPHKLVSCKEEASEMGGYFILNGLERVVRLLIVPKRNYPTSMARSAFRNRREGFTDKAVVIRCVREDQSAVTLNLYYLSNGSARVGFRIRGRENLLPIGLVLKALIETSDQEIFLSLTSVYNEKYEKAKGSVGTQILNERATIIIDEVNKLELYTHTKCLEYIGEYFKPFMEGMEHKSHAAVAEAVLSDFVLVHLDNNFDKFNLLIFMVQKLFSYVDQTSIPDNPDSLQTHEVLPPGQLVTIYIKERLQDWLLKSKRLLQDEIKSPKKNFAFGSLADIKKALDKNPGKQVGSAIENMLKTGRLVSQLNLDLKEKAGMTVQAERLNFLRFLSHFRAVHRGSSLAGLRTTSVRKLLPESWGFVCPVHTPDGTPCGLLNHLTAACRITSYYDSERKIRDFSKIQKSIVSVLIAAGMTPSPFLKAGPPEFLHVLLDGRVTGVIPTDRIEKTVSHLRRLKLSAASMIPEDLEVGYVPISMGGAFPGLFLFTNPARFIRPVRQKFSSSEENNNIELIGPFEQ